MDETNTTDSSSLPIIEENEKFLSTIITTSTELSEKLVTSEEGEQEKIADKLEEENLSLEIDQNNLSVSNLSSNQSPSPDMIISTLMDNLLTQIEPNENQQEVMKKDNVNESKTTTRTLRSHARKQILSTLDHSHVNDNRRVSNRRRILEKKYSLDTNERPRRKKTISERSSNNETSSNSDDQPIENHSRKIFTLKSSIIERISAIEETNLRSIADEDSNSTNPNKSISIQPDVNSLPPNKRRLRERNTTPSNASETIEENPSVETNNTRDLPINGIKQFLQIRQQVNSFFLSLRTHLILCRLKNDMKRCYMNLLYRKSRKISVKL